MTIQKMILIGGTVVVVAPILTVAMMSAFSRRPAGIGIKAGRLAACPNSPNCVSTQSTHPQHAIAPLKLNNASDPMTRLKDVIHKLPRARMIAETPEYLHAEFTSMLFRFVDDVEFLLDKESNVIHFRSASRTGYSDLGKNRARMEKLRQLFVESQASKPPSTNPSDS